MKCHSNPFRGHGLEIEALADTPWPSADPSRVNALLRRCPHANITPLADAADLAREARVARLSVKDERTRMGVGSFKAFGAAYVIASDAAEGAAAGQTYVTASAGNHGVSVAAGAAAFGANAVIFISETVPESFAERLRDLGAQVQRSGEAYEASMTAAQTYVSEAPGQRLLLSDSSWAGYTERPWRLMEGYLALIDEASAQLPAHPSHVFLQAGVGGFAVAMAAYIRAFWDAQTRIIVVEPEAAPALIASIEAGDFVSSQGPVSCMGRLDCKEPSVFLVIGLCSD